MPDRRLYTVAETCHLLSIKKTKVYQFLGTGELASVRIGRCRRISAEAIDQFVSQLAAASTEAWTS